MKKKILTFLVAICLIIPCLFGLAACKPKEKVATKTMTTSINPEITFMLDSKNNVTSISYGNADAGRLFANVNFVGQDASTAIQIVIEKTAISGHIDLSGNNTVTFEFSGEDIEKLKTDVEAKAKEVFKQMGVAITVISAEVKHQTLISTAKVLAPEMDSTEIENMSDEDLIKLIDKKLQDYKDLAYDQINDLQKNLDQAILNTIKTIRAEMEKLEAEMEKLGNLVSETIKQQYNNCKKQLEDEINKFLNERKENIAEAKKLAEAHKDALIALYKQEVEKTETIFKAHLEAAKANGIITEAQYNYWINLINSNKA